MENLPNFSSLPTLKLVTRSLTGNAPEKLPRAPIASKGSPFSPTMNFRGKLAVKLWGV